MKLFSKQVFLFFLGGLFILSTVMIGYYLLAPQILQENTVSSSTAPETAETKKQPQPDAITPAHEWSIVLSGDVIPARVTNASMVKRRDFFWPLQNIAPILQNADLTLINLESPLISGCPVVNEGMRFCGDGSFASALAKAGVDVANLSNNHSLNFGWDALAQTQELLAKEKISTTGFSAVNNNQQTVNSEQQNNEAIGQCNKDTFCSSFVIKELQSSTTNHEPRTMNIKVGFLGYNAVGQRVNREIAEKQIRAADTLVDVLIVSVHWGKEYEREPVPDRSLAPDDPKELGKLFIEWGADVVAGNHPHWWQRMEKYNDKLIIYAQGNTVFDQEWSVETRKGYLAKLYFDGKNILFNKIEITPIGLRNWGEAYILEGEEAQNISDTVIFNLN